MAEWFAGSSCLAAPLFLPLLHHPDAGFFLDGVGTEALSFKT
jgi:hypothetical protein